MILSAVAAAAPCDPVGADALRRRLDDAEAAYVGLDADGFEAALDAAALDLPCLTEPLPPGEVARWHGLAALQAFVRADRGGVAGSLAAAEAAVTGWRFPAGWIPEGHDLRSLAPGAAGPTAPIPPPARGATWLDGHPDARRATERPTVFQWVDAPGHAALSAYLLPGDPLPAYPTAAPVPPPPPPDRPAPPARSGPRGVAVASVAGGVVLAGASAAAFAGAARGRATFDGPGTPGWTGADLERLQARTNALEAAGWSAAGLGAVALAAGGLTWSR